MPKVNGFQVEEHGSGYQLTIRVHVGRDEELGDAHLGYEVSAAISEMLDKVSRCLGADNNLATGGGTSHQEDEEKSETL